ncbi:MAG: acyloxyacyl hydrolase [Bacteroidetes bacterium]|nr:acyloxyacyl hydrolase [Bacteroidota bacterium]
MNSIMFPILKNAIRFFLLLPLGLGQLLAFGQDSILPSGKGQKLFINVTGHYGFIIAHNPNMEYLIKQHIAAGEMDFIVQTNGEKKWERTYKNPEKGFGVFFADFGNPEQLGQGVSIFPFINFPLNPNRKFKLYIRSSDGIGYITKPYNRIENHKNNIIGSHVNAFVNLRLNTVFYPAKKIRMETGIGLTHFSNGSYAKPNLGINLATVSLGISFQKQEISARKKFSDTSAYKKYTLTLIAAAGPNETSPPNGNKYAGYMFSASGWKQSSAKSKFGIGLEAFYEFSNIEDAKRDTSFDTSKPLNNLQVGLKFGYELVIGKISLPLEQGVYLFSKTTLDGRIYHRIGIRYHINKHLIINYTLKTQWATAENLEFGIGYRF